MGGIFPVEIRNFLSLNELGRFIDEGISWYEGFLEEYNQRLGGMLREEGSSEEEVSKMLSEKGLAPKKAQSKDKSKGKSKASSKGWFSFKGLMLSAEKESKAEVFFEALDRIKSNLEKLKETKTLLGELDSIGLGPDVVYSAYLVEGVPEKVLVEPAGEVAHKYQLELFLSTSMESVEAVEKAAQEPSSEQAVEEGEKVQKAESGDEIKPETEEPKEKGEPEKEE